MTISIKDKFEIEKSRFLLKKDKSIKGTKDSPILKIINLINSKENYYTTSSCSGRIVICENDYKKKFNFLFISHDVIHYDNIKNIINKKYKNPVWFRQEGFILHVCCKTLKDAEKLLNLVMKIGLKRSGIISLKKNKITIEIIGTEVIATIIADKSRLLISDDYLKILINEANKKMTKNKEKINRLYEALQRLN